MTLLKGKALQTVGGNKLFYLRPLIVDIVLTGTGFSPETLLNVDVTNTLIDTHRVSVYLTPLSAAGLEIKPDTLFLYKNSTASLQVFTLFENGGGKVHPVAGLIWDSRPAGFLTVDTLGKITSGINTGWATVICRSTITGFSDSAEIHVINSPTLINSSFESPLVLTYEYNPTDPAWIFNGSGIEHNGSGFNAANAPDGVQAAFLQALGMVSQTITFDSGSYRIKFRAAQRGSNSQTIRVSLDETEIGLFTPSSTSFLEYITEKVAVSTGTHQLKFAGTNGDGDNTAFIDMVGVDAAGGSTGNDTVSTMQETLSLGVSPNPFNPSASISYYLPEKAAVTLTLLTRRGRLSEN